MPFSGHQGVKRTRDRIEMSFFFPNMKKRIETYVQSCRTCQLHSRSHWTDRSPIPRNEPSFGHIVFDCIGLITDSPWRYALVITDLHTRWPSAFALRSLSAKAVCKALIEFFSIFDVPTNCHSDRGANFMSRLTCLMLQRMGCSPRFNTSNRPLSSGLVERTNQSIKRILAKLAEKHPRK